VDPKAAHTATVNPRGGKGTQSTGGQDRPLLSRLEQAAKLIAGSLGGDARVSFAYAVMMYFTVTGFLGGYLLTRLYLQKAFENASN
jgi:hypothetical protein